MLLCRPDLHHGSSNSADTTWQVASGRAARVSVDDHVRFYVVLCCPSADAAERDRAELDEAVKGGEVIRQGPAGAAEPGIPVGGGEQAVLAGQHGFLARALQMRYPDEDQYQVHALYRFLTAAYPQDKPGAWQLAWDAYIQGSLTLAGFDEPTLARLRSRLPHIDAAAINGPMTRPTSG
jgi:hypothetical protein